MSPALLPHNDLRVILKRLRAHRSKHHIMQVGAHRQNVSKSTNTLFFISIRGMLGPWAWLLVEVLCPLMLSVFRCESITVIFLRKTDTLSFDAGFLKMLWEKPGDSKGS